MSSSGLSSESDSESGSDNEVGSMAFLGVPSLTGNMSKTSNFSTLLLGKAGNLVHPFDDVVSKMEWDHEKNLDKLQGLAGDYMFNKLSSESAKTQATICKCRLLILF